MFVLFFAVWVLLNGKLNWEIAVFGLVISAAIYLFCCKFMHYSPARDRLALRRLPRLVSLLATLAAQIVCSAFALLPYIYGGKRPDPVVVRFRPDGIESDTGRVMLANCITLTPGTITGSLVDGEFLVHCLDRSMAEGLDESRFVEKIRRWEAK